MRLLRQPQRADPYVKWITSTDHKTIGYLYLITSFAWFLIGGVIGAAHFEQN
jgi:heme/copper-type cytochrome/quinol oxidase subunit 1